MLVNIALMTRSSRPSSVCRVERMDTEIEISTGITGNDFVLQKLPISTALGVEEMSQSIDSDLTKLNRK